ncbi:hypothetical protein IFM89_000031 [Coptis chinensis]|uniref:Uncharacterized protein n=1 Tax=Coptis chinensis TaxID=261450 RepID=A0A835IFM1_9MAGN|nr:hypothetical protein IFM89_000031 [Coptis chinensis]
MASTSYQVHILAPIVISNINRGPGHGIRSKGGKLNKWRPMARSFGDRAADLVDHAAAMAFGRVKVVVTSGSGTPKIRLSVMPAL